MKKPTTDKALPVAIGEKIRALRLERNLTQAELAGDRITRNMLSRIENGAASPSLATLAYLADQLSVPVGYFVPLNEKEANAFIKLPQIAALRQAFAEKDAKKCLILSDELAYQDDEISYIRASATFSLAWQAAQSFALSEASQLLRQAETIAHSSVYCGETFFHAVQYTQRLFTLLITDEIPEELCSPASSGEQIHYEVAAYFTALKQLRSGEPVSFVLPLTAHRADHIKGVECAMNEQYIEAVRRLRTLADDPTLPFYMVYRVLSDLEKTADSAGNIRLAYSASKRKLNLIDRYAAQQIYTSGE